MTRGRAAVVFVLAVTFALVVANPADAHPRLFAFTAQCRAGLDGPPGAPQTFHIRFSAPKHVHEAAAFTVHVKLDEPALAGESAAATVTALPAEAISPPFGIVATNGPTARIDGDTTFTAVGPRGTRLEWRLDMFGRISDHIVETCSPTTDVVLGHTRIVR